MTQIEVPDNVQDVLANLLEVQFKLGMHAARRAGQTAFECKPAADALVAVCDGIKAALQDERDRWQSAVMLELDSNGQAHAIVAAALGPNGAGKRLP